MLVEADFNSRDREGHVLALVADFERPPAPGDSVIVRDDEGNSAEGDVAGIDGELARIAVRWSSWETGH